MGGSGEKADPRLHKLLHPNLPQAFEGSVSALFAMVLEMGRETELGVIYGVYHYFANLLIVYVVVDNGVSDCADEYAG